MNFYCKQCGHHYPKEEIIHELKDDFKEYFYCKKCNIEAFQEFELDDNNLDNMRNAINKARVLREQLVILENMFKKSSNQYFDCWDNRPLEWNDEL